MLRRFLLAAIAALILSPLAAMAAQPQAYDAKAFTDAQAAGKTILVHVHADWCPQCAAQRPIIAQLAASEKFKDMVIFNVDFDTQKPLIRQFNAQRQSTLIVYKGAKETGRSVGATQAAPITELLTAGL